MRLAWWTGERMDRVVSRVGSGAGYQALQGTVVSAKVMASGPGESNR